MTRRKDDDGRLTLDLIRDNMWKDVNCLPEQILEDIEAKGFKATLSAVQSTRSGFIANLTWLAKQGVYTAPILKTKISKYQRSKIDLRKKTMATKVVRMGTNAAQQQAA
jgi:hypothetical protein